MRSVLSAIRRMFAIDLDRMDAGVLVREFVLTHIVPALRRSSNEEMAEKFVKYANSPRPGNVIINTVKGALSHWGIDSEESADFVQDLMLGFLKPLRVGGKTITDNLMDFIPEQGVTNFDKLLRRIVWNRFLYQVREYRKNSREFDPGNREDVSVLRNVADPRVEDEEYIQEIVQDLKKFAKANLREDAYLMFLLWFNAIQLHGNVHMQNEVMRPYMRVMTRPLGTARWIWTSKVVPVIERFLRNELGEKAPGKIRRMLHPRTASEAITYDWYRRLMAAWVLG